MDRCSSNPCGSRINYTHYIQESFCSLRLYHSWVWKTRSYCLHLLSFRQRMVRVQKQSILSKKITWICWNSENNSLDSEGHLSLGLEISDLMASEQSKDQLPSGFSNWSNLALVAARFCSDQMILWFGRGPFRPLALLPQMKENFG